MYQKLIYNIRDNDVEVGDVIAFYGGYTSLCVGKLITKLDTSFIISCFKDDKGYNQLYNDDYDSHNGTRRVSTIYKDCIIIKKHNKQ